jgi:hypothetical protein
MKQSRRLEDMASNTKGEPSVETKIDIPLEIEEIINNVGYEYEWEISPREATDEILAPLSTQQAQMRDKLKKEIYELARLEHEHGLKLKDPIADQRYFDGLDDVLNILGEE